MLPVWRSQKVGVRRKVKSRRGEYEVEERGRRGRRKWRSGSERARTAIAHARSMVLKPYLSRPAFIMKGIIRPAVPVPACDNSEGCTGIYFWG
jgi:hypothetical protein